MSNNVEQTSRLAAMMSRDVRGIPVAMIVTFAAALAMAVAVAVLNPIH